MLLFQLLLLFCIEFLHNKQAHHYTYSALRVWLGREIVLDKKQRYNWSVKRKLWPNNKCIGYGIGETFATSLIFFYVYRPSMYYQTWDLRLWQILKIKWQSDNCSYRFAPDVVADVFLPKFSKFFNMLFFCNFLFHTIGNKNLHLNRTLVLSFFFFSNNLIVGRREFEF